MTILEHDALTPIASFADVKRLTIAPNNRLSNELTKQVIDSLTSGTKTKAIVAPQIYSLSAWIQTAWDELQVSGHSLAAKTQLISAQQRIMDYVRVIEKDGGLAKIMPELEPDSEVRTLSAHHIASSITEACRRLTLWELESYKTDSMESHRLLLWRNSLKQYSKGRMTEDEVLPVIIEAVNDGTLKIPDEVCLFSFDEIPPLYQRLFDTFSSKSSVFTDDFSGVENAMTFTLENFDKSEQFSHAANWCYQYLSEHPNARIAIVAPDLLQDKESIAHALDNVFEPQIMLPQTPYYTRPYNFSAGTAMNEVPIVAHALSILSVAGKQDRYNDILNIIRSPFIGDAREEKYRRARFDHYVRERGEMKMSLIQLLSYGTCPSSLSSLLTAFEDVYRNLPEFASLRTWMTHFEALLSAIGWPGDRNLTSEEYQAMQQFITAMRQISTCFGSEQNLNYRNALRYVVTYLKASVFAPETEDSQIQILGYLEATGLPFDAVLMMDVNEGSVPGTHGLNPFIPEAIQDLHAMPHSSPERELAFFETLNQRLMKCAGSIVYSYVLNNGEREMTPSIFAQGEPLEPAAYEAPDYQYDSLLLGQYSIKIVDDAPVPVPLSSSVKGGVGIMKKQIACPHYAFIAHRLRCQDMPTPVEGIPDNDAGSILHDALCFFWKEAVSQKALLAFSDEELLDRICVAVDMALALYNDKRKVAKELIAMERERYIFILQEWMKIEAQRQPFVVEVTEQTLPAKFGDLSISVKVDRLDLVQDSEGKFTRRLILDYKAGSMKLTGLAVEYLSDPQLPIYSLCDHDLPELDGGTSRIDGVAYANLKVREQSLLGIADDDVTVHDTVKPVSKVKTMAGTWTDTLDAWKARLAELADDFLQGNINITPSSKACDYCPGSLICRLNKS